MFKDKFTNDFYWEEPKWTTRMSGEDFDKKCKRDQDRGNVDVSEDAKCGIYSKASQCLNTIYDHWMYNIDLEQLIINLINTS